LLIDILYFFFFFTFMYGTMDYEFLIVSFILLNELNKKNVNLYYN